MRSEQLDIYKSAYDLLERLTDLAKDLPKFFRYSIGTRMVDLNLDMLGLVYRANMSRDNRPRVLTDLQIDYRQLQMLLRVCYHQKALSTGRYAELIKLLDSIGRQATAWKNNSHNGDSSCVPSVASEQSSSASCEKNAQNDGREAVV